MLQTWHDLVPFWSLSTPGSVGKDFWRFLQYFDDLYNFKEHLNVMSLWPFTISHWYDLVAHRGLNVCEPVGQVLKAASVDLLGNDAHSLRVVSLLFHTINAVLLWAWLKKFCCTKSHAVIFTCLLWWLSPINVEVIGWLSAQNYIFSLLFALLAALSVEYHWRMWTTLVLYALAVLCKAPAIAIVLPLIMRKLQLDSKGGGSYAMAASLVLTAGVFVQLTLHSMT